LIWKEIQFGRIKIILLCQYRKTDYLYLMFLKSLNIRQNNDVCIQTMLAFCAQDLHHLLNRSGECVGIRSGFLSLHTEFEFLEESLHQDEIEENQYSYHSDHLGSSSWITDASGEAYQHMQNMPYGEQFIEQRQSSWGAVYQFTGKERDPETGFDYAHARYYSSDLSIFLSVDPLSEERPNLSPYNYSSWNPVMRIDPNGELDDWVERNGEIVYDKDVKKGEDGKIQNLKEGDKYLGKSGSAIDPETDQYTRYNEDGTKTSKPISLEGVEVHGSGAVNNINNPSISTNNKKGYYWNRRDLAVWQHLKNSNDPISRYVRFQMYEGNYLILSYRNAYNKYGGETMLLLIFKNFLQLMMELPTEGPNPNKLFRSNKSRKGFYNTPSHHPPSFQKYLKMTKGKYKGGKKGENLKKAWKDYKKIYG